MGYSLMLIIIPIMLTKLSLLCFVYRLHYRPCIYTVALALLNAHWTVITLLRNTGSKPEPSTHYWKNIIIMSNCAILVANLEL